MKVVQENEGSGERMAGDVIENLKWSNQAENWYGDEESTRVGTWVWP